MFCLCPTTLTGGCTENDARPWREVQQRVGQLIQDKIIVGYSLWQDLSGERDIGRCKTMKPD